MHTNAIESWLVRMHRHATRIGRPVDWRFHVQLEEPGLLESQYPVCVPLIRRSSYPLSHWARFFWTFARLCRAEKFDVVHIHADVMSAPYLLTAALAGVPHRIVHVHNADETVPVRGTSRQRALRGVMRRICLALGDTIAGNSNHVLDTFLAGRPRRAGRDVVHLYGIDNTPFLAETDNRTRFRRELGFQDDALILLFAGRLVPEKNPEFAVSVLAELRRLEPRAVGVFAGTGGLESRVRASVSEYGLENAVRMLGWRSDIPDVMRGSDWFILPRPDGPSDPQEGFGVAVVEAQLAGLRLLLSNAIGRDPLLPGASFRQLGLFEGTKAWAAAAVELLAAPPPGRAAAAAGLKASPMDLDQALDALIELHA